MTDTRTIWAFDDYCGFNGEADDLICPSCGSDIPETFAEKVVVYVDVAAIKD
jgi:hypothetical protein